MLNTPVTDTNISIERRRPNSFFIEQAESNKFNRSISGAKIIDFPIFNELHTYEGVYFAKNRNHLVYEKVAGFL